LHCWSERNQVILADKAVPTRQPTRFLTFPALTIVKSTFRVRGRDKEGFRVETLTPN